MGHKFSVWLGNKLAPGLHEHLIARTRFIDDLIEEAATTGAEQYVILGAGYDLRAHRLDLPSSLRVFEVDQAEVQARKRSKLPENLTNSDNVTYVAVDFTHQSLAEQLTAAGFDIGKPTVFTLRACRSTLQKRLSVQQSKNWQRSFKNLLNLFLYLMLMNCWIKILRHVFVQGLPKRCKTS